MNLHDRIDRSVLKEVHHFFEKINERNLFVRGLVPRYDPPSAALGPDVEYFSSQITLDDRMQYIMRHIVTSPRLSAYNKLGNTIISHFYGARGIHQVLSGIESPDEAHVDFEEIAREQIRWKDRLGGGRLTKFYRDIAYSAKIKKIPLWGTTELHTSIQDAGHKFVDQTWGPEFKTPFAVAEWIASWINDGFMDKLLSSRTLKEMFTNLTSKRGIGPYYGYHCATSNSVNPDLPFSHDEDFCSPGPGACMTLDLLFPGVSKKEVPYGDRVIWIRKNQDELFPGLRDQFHPETWNVTANGVTIFKESQNELKVYGTEVGLCQFSVYCRLRDNPHLISKRKVARVDTVESSNPIVSFFT